MEKLENWIIREEAFPFKRYHHKETVFTIGNGYFSTRGSFEEGFPGDMATTFVGGVFNDVPLYGTELVNFPNPFALEILLDGEMFQLDYGRIVSFERTLDMASGLLTREVLWESPAGKRARFRFERLAHMGQIHRASLRFSLTSENFDGPVEIRSPLPGVVSNLDYMHWRHISQGALDENTCFLHLETSKTEIQAAVAASVTMEATARYQGEYWDAKWMPTLVFRGNVKAGESLRGTKHAWIYTSREVDDPLAEAASALRSLPEEDFDAVVAQSRLVWDDLWSRSNVDILGDDLVDRALRYNLFQILIAAPRHDDRISIGAKTMSGYGYRGHVFWDTEIFILPFLIYTQPEIARNLLMYRYHTLESARDKARRMGYQGAMYAWESAMTGQDVTPVWIPLEDGSLVRVWCGEIEQHISADIAYGILQYWHATGDDAFMIAHGCEMVLSIAQFYASRLEEDHKSETLHISDVIGPDEYHEHVDDNAMTNLMATWVLEEAHALAGWLAGVDPQKHRTLLEKLSLDHLGDWPDLASRIWINRLDSGLIEQFQGYFNLEFLDQFDLEPRTQSLQAQFGIEGVQKFQFIKQPDVVMAQYLLQENFSSEEIIANMEYYSPRTDFTFGSSLGPSIQAVMLSRFGDVGEAYRLFRRTLLTDLEDNRGNTRDGIHAASAGAVWQVLAAGFMGMKFFSEYPVIAPRVPENWRRVRFRVIFRNKPILFDKFLKHPL
jgi:trehalose/maltose hydrolase-like predicted phosphorylase